VVMGIVLSVPPMGPTNFAIMAKGFKKDIRAGVAIGAGAGVVDMFYILVAYGGLSAIISLIPENIINFFAANEHILKIILTFAGCGIVVFLGIKIMKMKTMTAGDEIVKKKMEMASEKAKLSVDKLHKTEHQLEKILHHKIVKEENESNFAGNFFTGVFLCFSSVTLPAAWFGMVTYLKGYGIISSNFWSGLLFGIGVCIGTTLWFYFLTKIISSNSHKISPKALGKINISVGIILISLGAFLLYKAFDFALS
jgi:threonine/homoserine/homoserine lactone efflux protein